MVKLPADVEYGSGSGPKPTIGDDLVAVWHDMGSSVSEAWDYTASLPSRAWEGAKAEVRDVVIGAQESVGSVFDWIQGKILWILGIGLLILIVLAKTGVIPQIADMFRALYGG